MGLAIFVIPCCCFTPIGKGEESIYVTTRELSSSFCPPDRVDAIYRNIKLIQRISFERWSLKIPNLSKPDFHISASELQVIDW